MMTDKKNLARCPLFYVFVKNDLKIEILQEKDLF